MKEKTADIVYAIKNKDGLYATYGRSEFKEGMRFARLYKSKETALRHYFNNKGEYDNLKLVKFQISCVQEESINPLEFENNLGRYL